MQSVKILQGTHGTSMKFEQDWGKCSKSVNGARVRIPQKKVKCTVTKIFPEASLGRKKGGRVYRKRFVKRAWWCQMGRDPLYDKSGGIYTGSSASSHLIPWCAANSSSKRSGPDTASKHPAGAEGCILHRLALRFQSREEGIPQ